MASIDTKIAESEKRVQELKAQKASEEADPKDREIKFLKSALRKNGVKAVKNNCHGNALDYNFDYQLDQGKKDAKNGIYQDFDESKNHWTFSNLGNLYEDYLNDGGTISDYERAEEDDDDDDDDEDSDDDDGYVNHIFF